LLVAVLALASCGGGGEVGAGGEESLKKMIAASVVETGPESCLKFSTLRFLEEMHDLEGEAAIEACEESAMDLLVEQPTKADVSRVDVEGDSATALVVFTGSILDGQKMRYAFVERDGRWKYDVWRGFVDLDSAHLILEAGRDGMLRAKTPWEVDNVVCWIGRMERMSDKQLEELLLGEGAKSSNCIAESNSV
jgi:hypothetical protein